MREHRPAGAANPADAIDAEGETLLHMRIPALARRLKDVRDAVRAAVLGCGCSDTIAGDIVIAVDEACQNIVRHAYADEPGGEFIVEVRRDGNAVVVLLRDFAKVVDPDSIRPRNLDDLRPGGLGTHFMREIMDDIAFQQAPGTRGNLLRMVKRIA